MRTRMMFWVLMFGVIFVAPTTTGCREPTDPSDSCLKRGAVCHSKGRRCCYPYTCKLPPGDNAWGMAQCL
jgi:hypothetical protein